ncbi:2OG-Fe dioxygenase family protein [Burkholderia sola]|uniref:2OG-Fe dioxygenase family protein n=1 Tax=Burkholderia sola TaxID=2843302 RepID=UPI0023DD6A15|nr:2OG-Fe dioxygenase family protein [Burkholderia sola]
MLIGNCKKGEGIGPLLARPLTDVLDTVVVHDAVPYHGVNAVQQANPDELAFRDMLLISISSAR